MIIESKGLECQRGKGAPMRFPDLALAQGQSLLLLGASGSGKTSLLSILSGLLKPQAGDVFLHGQNLYALPPGKRDAFRGQYCGFVFQSFHLLPFLSVKENILLSARFSGASDDTQNKMATLLETLGLSYKTNARVQELSQGEQQRVCLARSLAHAPSLLFADEPTSALDDDNAFRTMALMQTLARDHGTALIVATHDKRIMEGFDTRLVLNGETK